MDAEKLQVLRAARGIEVEGFILDERTFGTVKCFNASIKGIDCAVIMPVRSHYTDVLEIISRCHLRRTLGLKDGDELEVRVTL